MRIYILCEDELINLLLPKNINGFYKMTYKANDLLFIEAVDNRWIVKTGDDYNLLFKDNVYEKLALGINGTFQIEDAYSQQKYDVFVSSAIDNTYTLYTLTTDTTLNIGSSSQNEIIYSHTSMADKCLSLTCQDSYWLASNINNNKAIYINNINLKGNKNLQNGDLIFIYGLKIIVLGNNLVINNPGGKCLINTNSLVSKQIEENNVATDRVDDNPKKLYDDDEYFIRSPRFFEKVEKEHFVIDNNPSDKESEESPLLLTIGPMLTMGMSSVSSLATSVYNYSNNKSLISVLPSLLISASMLLGTFLWPSLSRKYQKKKEKEKLEKIRTTYCEYLQKKEHELEQIQAGQRQIIINNNYSTEDCYNMIMGKSRKLFMREYSQDDFLNVRLGIGKVLLDVDIKYPEEHFELDQNELYDKMKEMLNKYKYIEETPIIQSLTDKRIISIIGGYNYIKKFTDKILIQILALHSYYDLKIAIFTNEKNKENWNAYKKCLHLFRDDKEIRFFATNDEEGKEVAKYLNDILSSRSEAGEKENNFRIFNPYFLVITDNYDEIRNYEFIEKYREKKNNMGMTLLILNESLEGLPTECFTFIGVNSDTEGGLMENDLSKDSQKIFKIEPFNSYDIKKVATYISNVPIKSKKEKYSLPKYYNFLEMFQVGKVEYLNSLERWNSSDSTMSLATPIGIGNDGSNINLDLHEKTHGPHGLVAGMTGSGKSDLLLSYILSLAVNYHPNDVQFLLIDYKGGGLAAAFENKEKGIKLPHLAGTITNLDKSDIERALASIKSELERRQEMFNEAKTITSESTIDIYKYQKYYHSGVLKKPLAHLFIISDEFAELKTQQPEFMDQLISTARIGRSLGIHLILATQKPSGVVNDQIWSNSRFKICLKVQDASDSNEVIKRPDAAYLKDSGRFYLQVGYNESFELGQAGYTGASYIPSEKVQKNIDDDINFINTIGVSYKNSNFVKNSNQKNNGEQLGNVVKYLSDLAKEQGIKIENLWLEKLRNIIYIDSLNEKYKFTKKDYYINPIIGEYDDPKRQEQHEYHLSLSENGNTVIYSSEEKNTIISSIIYSLISNYSTKELNMYILDFDAETLPVYLEAPQVGDVVFASEDEKVNNFFRLITNELTKRKEIMQKYNANYEFYVKSVSNPLPNIVTIIHGFENFKETYEDKLEPLEKIMRECTRYGMYFIITAINERAVKSSIRNSIANVIPLKLPSLSDYTMLLGKKCMQIAESYGRGIVLVNEEPHEVQLSIIDSEEKAYDKIKELITNLKANTKDYVSKIKVLPKLVKFEDFDNQEVNLNSLPVGIEEETLDSAYIDITKSVGTLIVSNGNENLNNYINCLHKIIVDSNKYNIVTYDYLNMIDNKENSIDFANLNTQIFSTRSKQMVIFITGVEKWLDSLPKEVQDDMPNFLEKIQKLNNCFFILADRQADIKQVTYQRWFKKYIAQDNGVYIGNGISSNSFFTLTVPYRELMQQINNEFGYNIVKGKIIKVKLLGGVSDGE